MKARQFVLIASATALLSGCGAYAPSFMGPGYASQMSNPSWSNAWLIEADDVGQGRRADDTGNAERNVAAVAARPDAVQMPLREDVRRTRAQQTAAAQDAEAGAMRRTSIDQSELQACTTQRAAFGDGLAREVNQLIQLQIDQAHAVAASTIDAATKAQLLLELSRSVRALSQRSKSLEFFRDGIYALCQAHATGAITSASYADRFESLLKNASETIQLENASFQFEMDTGRSVQPQPVSLQRH